MKWSERFLVVVDVDGRAGLRCDTCGMVLGPIDDQTLSTATQAAALHHREQHWTPRVGVVRGIPKFPCQFCGVPVVRTLSGHFMDDATSYRCAETGTMHVAP